jgi:hypothetical protein
MAERADHLDTSVGSALDLLSPTTETDTDRAWRRQRWLQTNASTIPHTQDAGETVRE